MKRYLLISLLILVHAVATAQAPARPLTVTDVLEKVRAAVGYAALTKLENGLAIDGGADFLELKGKFRWRYKPDGSLFHELQGPISMSLRFDGQTGWVSNWAGLERRLEMEDLESFQTEFWVLSNRWLAPDSPFEIALASVEPGDEQVHLGLKRRAGILEAEVAVDRKTWLPAKFKYRSTGKTQTWTFESYQTRFGVAVPLTMIAINESSTTRYQVENVSKGANASTELFTLAPRKPIDTDWIRDASPRLEIKRARSGHLLVKPMIDGRFAGWFLLDSGAGAMIITPRVANESGMESFGKVPVRGVGGTIQSPFRRGKKFELGQLVIRNPLYVEIDFAAISRAIGEEIAGLCGYDLFARSVVTLDSATPTLELREPTTFKLEEGTWQEMFIDSNIPHIRCRFEGDREDVFRLDTGADNTVSFHSPAVDKYLLLEGRQTQSAVAGGVGGTVAVARGKLNWFEIAGHRFANPQVNFSLAKSGAFANPYSAGNIGGAFLSKFKIVFNYGERRIALIEK
ncbi:MAG: aspartyl protease family protein [Acidobacteriota bacterium]